MSIKKILLFLALSNTQLFSQNSIGMNLNSENIELQSSWDVLNLTDYTNGTHYSFDANYLHTDSDSFIQGEHLIQVGFFAQNTFHNSQSLFLSFGMKTILTEDYIALAIGGKAKYILDLGVDVPPSSINAEISFAPSLLSFIDADSYMDFRLEADMEIIPNILIYGGYRHIDTEYIQYSETLNDNFYAGMKITF